MILSLDCAATGGSAEKNKINANPGTFKMPMARSTPVSKEKNDAFENSD